MNAAPRIDHLIKTTIRRAVRESVAGTFVLLAFAFLLQHSLPGTARYYGCLLVLVSTPFTLGVVWSHTLSDRLLRTHSAADTAFWQEAFRVQARLLRSAPLWYLAPLCSGMLLVFASAGADHFGFLMASIATVAAVFAGVASHNHAAANQLDESAVALLA